MLEKAEELKDRLKGLVRIKLDSSDKTPGWKFAEYEMKGVPLRLEIGPKDIENNQCILARRDTGEKITVALDEVEQVVVQLLDTIQKDMLERARENRDTKTYTVTSLEEFVNTVEHKPGFIKAMWCGDRECEDKIKEMTGATSRCIPFEQEKIADTCVCCGKTAAYGVLGKAY